MPATPNGELMDIVNKAMKGSAAPLGFKTLVMKDGERSVKADLVRTNPFPDGLGCGRKGCIMCNKEPSKGKCWWSNCVYKITCTRAPCTTGGVLPTYVGETCRTLKTRGEQHLTLYKGKSDKSFMWNHTKDSHGGVIGTNDYEMNPISRFQDSMPRILTEAVVIQRNESDPKTKTLNSKIEYFCPEYVRPSFSKGPADVY